ncbi:MAG: type II CAAX endopeptidase family protein [Halobacteriales archaeon]|nr:type II CAAX endopeptidase family protein [Halobacteriales archaeon]
MSDRTAASAGVVMAGIGLAAAVMPWPIDTGSIAAILAAIALVAFLARRYGRLPRRQGAPLAGGMGVLLAIIGTYTLVQPAIGAGSGANATPPVILTLLIGLCMTVAAYSDWLGIDRDTLLRKLSATGLAAAIGAAGIAAIVLWGLIIVTVVRTFLGIALRPTIATALSTIALGFGTATVAIVYLRASDRGFEFIDVGVPSLRDFGFVVAGVVTIIGLNLAIGWLFQQLGVESASHSVIETAQSTPEILLVLIPLTYLIIGPGEELLYRNVVQKSLYEAFSRPAAVVVASAIFASAHFFAYASGNVLATINTLTVIFALSMILGLLYARTNNVVVPALVHGTLNAVAFAASYAEITGRFDLPFLVPAVDPVTMAVMTLLTG